MATLQPIWRLIIILSLGLTALPALADMDGDGIPDRQDNCLERANGSQLDTNGDGYGNACDPDINNDGIVNLLDLLLFRAAFLTSPGDPEWDPDIDFNGDNVVNLLDLLIFRGLFLQPPGPVGQVRWINPESGNWNDAANWFPNKPIAPNFALIDTPGIVVTHDSGNNECAGILSDADIELSGGTLTVNGDLDMQGTLTMTNVNSRLRNARVLRSMPTEGTAPLTVTTGVVLDNITLATDLTIDNALTVNFDNGLTLDGAVLSVISDGSVTQAIFRGTQTLGGVGEVHYSGSTTNDTRIRVYAQNDGDILTVGPGVTVRSDPTGGWLGTTSAGRGLTMAGTVIADDSGAQITVQGDPMSMTGTLTADGAIITTDGDWTASSGANMTAVNGGELELHGTWVSEATVNITNSLLDVGSNNSSDSWDNNGTITLTGSDAELGGVFGPADIGNLTSSGTTSLDGRLVLTGLTFDLDAAPGTWQLAANGIIQDGMVTGTLLPIVGNGDLDGTTLALDTEQANGTTVDVFNGLTLDNSNYTIISNGSVTQMIFQGDQLLGGTGTLTYGGTTTNDTRNRVYANPADAVLTVDSGILVQTGTTGGWLGTTSANRGLTVLGSVDAGTGGAELLVRGEPLFVDATLTASNGAILILDGNWTASDTTTMTATSGAELELFGNWSSEATIDVTDGLLDIGDNNNADTWINLGTIVLTSSNAEFGGVFVPGDIGNTTIDGLSTLNGRLILTGLTFNVDTEPGTWRLGTNGIIQDGTVTGSLLPVVGNGDFDGTTLNLPVDHNNGLTVDVFNGLTINSDYTIISNGSVTQLIFNGSQILDGNGQLIYGGTTTNNTRSRIFAGGAGDVLTIDENVTVRTDTIGGWLGTTSAGRGLTLMGSAIADTSGAVLTIQGDPLSIEGSISGSAGADIIVDGNWTASDGSTMTMAGGGTLELNGTWNSAAIITVTDSFLDIGNNASEPWDNNGSIALDNSDASLGGSYDQAALGTFSSNGIVTADGLLDNSGQTLNIDVLPGTWKIGSGTILGGTITGTLLEVTGSNGALDNVILNADMDLLNGVALSLRNGLNLNATITLKSDGSVTQLIAAGTQTVDGNGQVLFGGTTTNDTRNRFFAGSGSDVLTIDSGVTVAVGTAGGWLGTTSTNRGLNVSGNVISAVAGKGLAIYGDPISITGTIAGSLGGNIQIDGDWTAGAAADISMVGGGELELFGQWINNGAITVTNSLLDIGSNTTSDIWTNLGTIDLVDSSVELGGLFSFADLGALTSNADVIINGFLDNTGLILDLDTAPGTWQLGASGKITGGTVTGTSFLVSGNSSLDGVTLDVDTTIGNGVTNTVTNGLTLINNKIVTLASSGSVTGFTFNGTQTLGGNGQVLFGGTTTNPTRNRLVLGASTNLTIDQDITIRPLTVGGFIGSTSSGRQVTLLGTIRADMPEVITLNGRPFTNNGTIELDAGSSVAGTSDYVQGAGGSLAVELSGTDPSQFGRIDMTSSSTLSLGGTLNISVSAFTPSLGDMFEILGASSRTGTFPTVTGTDAGPELAFVPIYNPDNVTLEVQ